MATDVEICRNALLHLGEESINSLNDGTDAANTCKNLYPPFRTGMFAAHAWNFARNRVQLLRNVTAPINQWTYSYAIPASVARPEAVFNTTSAGARARHDGWERVSDAIETDFDTIVLKYIEEKDEGQWPGSFVTFMEWAFATQICMAITSNRSLLEQVRAMAYGTPGDNMRGGMFAIARHADGASNLSPVIDDYALLQARWGGDFQTVR